MADNNKRNVLNIVAVGLRVMNQIIDSSSSESSSEDEELQVLERHLHRRTVVPRLENYVEHVLPALSDQEFKAHFR